MSHDLREIKPLPNYQFIETPMSGCDGFRLSHFRGDTLAATESCVHVVNFEVFPPEIAQLLAEKEESGVPTYIGNISVDTPFLHQGLGPAIWKATMKRLVEKHPTVIVSDVDDSIPTNWTRNMIPKVREYMQSLGWKAEVLYEGDTDGKPTWVTQYSPITD